MTGAKRIKRKRGRPPEPLDHLFHLFVHVEEEAYRTGKGVNWICSRIDQDIAKHGPLQFVWPETGEKAEIKSIGTARARYYEVVSAMSPPRRVPEIDEVHYRRVVNATLDGALLTRKVRIINRRTGEPMEAVRLLGQWGETKKKLQARRQAALQARRRKLHNK